jgi:carbon storage regulator
MLVFGRKVGERIVFGDGVEIFVAKISKNEVRLAIRAPATEAVYRGEVWDAIASANRDAAQAAFDVSSLEGTAPGELADAPGPVASLPLAGGDL